MLYYLQSYLFVLVETICCVIFFEIFENKDKENKNAWIARWITILCLSILTFAEANIFQNQMVIRLFTDIGLTTLIMLFYMKERVSKCFVLCIIFEGLMWLADFITILINPFLAQSKIEESEIRNFLIIILSKMLLFLIIIIIKNVFHHNTAKYIRGKDWLFFLVMPFFSVGTTIIFIKNISLVTGTDLEWIFALLALGLAGMNIVMFYFMQNIGKREYLLHENALLELETKNQLKLYETISEQVQNQRKLSHEYKNQLICIQSLCATEEYGQLKEYLQQINGEVLHDLDYIDTGHTFINAVLNAKYEEAIRKNISLVCKINDLSELTMSSSDLVILLSNLLNNAIEACEKCNTERNIKIKCIYENDELILSIKNTYNGKLNEIGKNLYTIKEQDRENHGIGLKNVIQIIEKNDGYYAVEHTDTEFWISVIVPQTNSAI